MAFLRTLTTRGEHAGRNADPTTSWYFWADTAVKKHKAIYALPTSHTQKSPSVKYRGIFLNDEQPALTSWVENNFPHGKYGPGFHKEFYSLVFELLLRLKANFLWPTMWNSMFAVDDPENPKNADYYGIVMSTSHTEPLQMSTEEWNKLGNGTWDYTSNEEAIRKYWEKGVQRVKDYEGVWTVGMRGNGDRVLSDTLVTELLERIVHDQRDILKKGLGVSDVSQVPQVWCLYKDVSSPVISSACKQCILTSLPDPSILRGWHACPRRCYSPLDRR